MLGMLFGTRRLSRRAGLLLVLAVAYAPAQTVPAAGDDSTLKQIILFGRHGVRSAAFPYSAIQMFASQPYPDFGVPTGYLTPHGYQAQQLLGAYYHDYLVHEGLLSGNPRQDLIHSYFRANSIQRSNVSAAALGAALIPGVTTPVHSFPLGTPDPVFDPIAGGVVTSVDTARAVAEAAGVFNKGTAIQAAYAPELSLIRSVLFHYPMGTQPLPPVPPGLVDPTSLPVPLTANTTPATFNIIDIGGIFATVAAADPFVMEYAGGLPLDQVAWGQLNLETLSQQTRLIGLSFQLQATPPYLNRIQSSNAVSHILRTMEQAVGHQAIPGAFGDENSELVVINSSDTYVAGVAGLLQLHWLLPGYQPDYCAPGGNLVFELRQSKAGEYFVRVYYTAQTFDELRNLTPLTLEQPPETMQLLIPGGSKSSSSLDVDFVTFERILQRAIAKRYVQNSATETLPGVLTGVPLQ